MTYRFLIPFLIPRSAQNRRVVPVLTGDWWRNPRVVQVGERARIRMEATGGGGGRSKRGAVAIAMSRGAKTFFQKGDQS